VTVNGRLKVNTPDGIYRAVLDGIGIAYAPVWLFEKELNAGRVEPLLINESGRSHPYISFTLRSACYRVERASSWISLRKNSAAIPY
jgi:DNA-binding transcriptional LysR family regulator